MISVTVSAVAVGQLWAEGEASKEVSLSLPWCGSLRGAVAALRQTENGGGDFQRGTVRLEAATVRYRYRRGRAVHSVTCAVPERTVDAVNA